MKLNPVRSISPILFCLLSYPLPGCQWSPPSATEPSPSSKIIPLGNEIKNQQVQTMYEEYRTKYFPEVPEITANELLTLEESLRDSSSSKKLVIVDVREEKERRVSIIPRSISQKDFEKHGQYSAETFVVVYCTIGYRSGLYAKKLSEDGLKASNLAGGILAWAWERQLFYTSSGNPTKQIHVYGSKWNLLPSDYKGIW